MALMFVASAAGTGCKDKSGGGTSTVSSTAPTTAAPAAPVPATVTRAWCEDALRGRLRARFRSDAAVVYAERDVQFREKVIDEGVTNVVASCVNDDGKSTDPVWTCYWDAPLKTYRDCANARKKATGARGSLGLSADTFKDKWNAPLKEHGDRARFVLGAPARSDATSITYSVATDAELVLVKNEADGSLRSITISAPTSAEEFFENPATTTVNVRVIAWRRVLEALVPDINAKQRRELEEEVIGLGRLGPIKDKPATASVTRLGFKFERFEKDGRRLLRVSDPADPG